MKEKALPIFLLVIIIISIVLTYQRSFVWQNFEVTNSEEEFGGDEDLDAALKEIGTLPDEDEESE